MRVSVQQRKKLEFYLRKFYEHYPEEKFTVFHFVRYFKKRLKNKKDCWMSVSGETGSGKSLFVLMSQVLFGRYFSLEHNVTYIPKGDEIMNKFDKINFGTLLVDEAAKEMRAVNWQSKQQQKVNTAAMTDRFKNNWVFLNIPNFNEMTKSMKRGNLQFRAIVLFREKNYARVVVQRKSRNWRSEDPWSDKLATDRYEKAEKKYGELDNETILNLERGLPNTIMDFIVPNLEIILPEVTTKYEELKAESRKIIQEEVKEQKKDKYKDKYKELTAKVANILINNTLQMGKIKVTRSEMASALGVSEGFLRDSLNRYEELKSNDRKRESYRPSEKGDSA